MSCVGRLASSHRASRRFISPRWPHLALATDKSWRAMYRPRARKNAALPHATFQQTIIGAVSRMISYGAQRGVRLPASFSLSLLLAFRRACQHIFTAHIIGQSAGCLMVICLLTCLSGATAAAADDFLKLFMTYLRREDTFPRSALEAESRPIRQRPASAAARLLIIFGDDTYDCVSWPASMRRFLSWSRSDRSGTNTGPSALTSIRH